MIQFIVLAFSAVALSACSLPFITKSDKTVVDNNQISATPTFLPAASNTPDLSQTTIVTLKIASGPVAIKLYTQDTPKTVANFLQKVSSGFYDGLIFHRVESEFVVQGGDPNGNGTGGGTIKSEINPLPFRRGSVGLARGPVKEESNDSQFFICLATENCSHLTNEYVNFGEVISGMDIVDKIRVGDKIIETTTNTK